MNGGLATVAASATRVVPAQSRKLVRITFQGISVAWQLSAIVTQPADEPKEEEEIEKSEGFWQEFFLHKPDAKALEKLLASLSADDLLHLQAHPQQLLIRAIARIKDGKEPADEHGLDV